MMLHLFSRTNAHCGRFKLCGIMAFLSACVFLQMEAAPARRSKGKRLTVSIETNVDGRIRPLEPWEINRGT